MSITVLCQGCQRPLRAPDGAEGRKVRCAKCNTATLVPKGAPSGDTPTKDVAVIHAPPSATHGPGPLEIDLSPVDDPPPKTDTPRLGGSFLQDDENAQPAATRSSPPTPRTKPKQAPPSGNIAPAGRPAAYSSAGPPPSESPPPSAALEVTSPKGEPLPETLALGAAPTSTDPYVSRAAVAKDVDTTAGTDAAYSVQTTPADENPDGSIPLAQPRPHAVSEFLKGSLRAYGHAAQNAGGAARLAMVVFVPALAMAMITAWLVGYLAENKTPTPGLLAACLPELAMAILLLGIACRYFLFNARIGIDNTDEKPDLSLDVGEAFMTGMKVIALQVIYIVPVITIPFYPLAMLAFAHTEDSRAFNPAWAVRAAIRQPGAWLMLWAACLAWLIAAAFVGALLALGMITLVHAIDGSEINRAVGAVLKLAGAFVCAFALFAMVLIPSRFTGLLGYCYPNLIQLLPGKASTVTSVIGGVIVLAALSVPAYFLYLEHTPDHNPVAKTHHVLLAHMGLREFPADPGHDDPGKDDTGTDKPVKPGDRVPSQPQRPKSPLLTEADQVFDDGDFPAALTKYQEALEEAWSDEDATDEGMAPILDRITECEFELLLAEARVLMEQDKLSEALARTSEARRKLPRRADETEAMQNEIVKRMTMRDYADVVASAKQSLEAGQFEQAREAAQKAVRLVDSSDVEMDASDAQNLLRQIDREWVASLLGSARQLLEDEQFAQAREETLEAQRITNTQDGRGLLLQIDLKWSASLLRAAKALQSEGKFQEARGELLKAQQLNDTSDVQRLLVEVETEWLIKPATALQDAAVTFQRDAKSSEAVEAFAKAVSALREAEARAGVPSVRDRAQRLLRDVEYEWLDEKYIKQATDFQVKRDFLKADELFRAAMQEDIVPANRQKLQTQVNRNASQRETYYKGQLDQLARSSARLFDTAKREDVEAAKKDFDAKKFKEAAAKYTQAAKKFEDAATQRQQALEFQRALNRPEMEKLEKAVEDLVAQMNDGTTRPQDQLRRMQQQLTNMRASLRQLQAPLDAREEEWTAANYELHMARGMSAVAKAIDDPRNNTFRPAKAFFEKAQELNPRSTEVGPWITECKNQLGER